MQFTIARDVGTLQKTLTGLAKEGKRIGLVPTMGALHAGHLGLVDIAKQYAEAAVVSIFVNPKQFGPGEDFEKYPRMLEEDIKKAEAAGAAMVYAPSVEDMYSPTFCTNVSVGPLGQILCGKSRSGHFDGVATVVAKLLLRVLPHVAVFGEKDYQQLCVVSRLVYDLDMPIEIVGAPTMRETDGLAMSSRNRYLNPAERAVAPKLYETLELVATRIEAENVPVREALAEGTVLLQKAGFTIDYLELRESFSLKPMEKFAKPARLLAAVQLGKTRLIDNVALEAA